MNWAIKQLKCHRMIVKYGYQGVLRRASGDRNCWVCEADHFPSKQQGSVGRSEGRVFLISPIAPDGADLVAPDEELDLLVLPTETHRLTTPPGKLAPGNVVMYWELRVEGPGQ